MSPVIGAAQRDRVLALGIPAPEGRYSPKGAREQSPGRSPGTNVRPIDSHERAPGRYLWPFQGCTRDRSLLTQGSALGFNLWALQACEHAISLGSAVVPAAPHRDKVAMPRGQRRMNAASGLSLAQVA